MSDDPTTSDRLRSAADHMEQARVEMQRVIDDPPFEDLADIIERSEDTTGDLEEVVRDMMVHAEFWEKTDEMDEAGIINITDPEEDDE